MIKISLDPKVYLPQKHQDGTTKTGKNGKGMMKRLEDFPEEQKNSSQQQ